MAFFCCRKTLITEYFFYSCFHLYGNLFYTDPSPFSPFLCLPFFILCHFLLYYQSHSPWECDGSHSLLCCITFARGHRETAENLYRYSRPFNRVCSQSNSLWKMTSRSAFRCAGRGPAVTHRSTDPVKSCSTWAIAWLLSICCHISIILHYFNIIINFERFWELPVYWYCNKSYDKRIDFSVSVVK